jgi:hypothetical protein
MPVVEFHFHLRDSLKRENMYGEVILEEAGVVSLSRKLPEGVRVKLRAKARTEEKGKVWETQPEVVMRMKLMPSRKKISRTAMQSRSQNLANPLRPHA